ncbi:hypothetical protein F5Y18DRAFT_334099 [Xylariaceae sp. FL1019]|nr:hypothetical protein F5Y18DRAFT_334099 [Xylariaceae sp. FL1019]
MSPDFFHINGPKGSGHARPPPPPPASGQPFVPQPGPVPPPRDILPADLYGGPGPFTQINDVTRDLLSEADMIEELSEYRIFRFEKMTDKNMYDEHGRRKWLSWEKALRTEDMSISSQAASERIRHLNMTSKPVIDKKNSLTTPLKRQIDSTLESLVRSEPDLGNFQWVLAQVDHQLRPLGPYYTSGAKHHDSRKHRHSSHRPSSRKKSNSRQGRHHEKRTKAYERLSLTAYFKKIPRPGVGITRLWQRKRAGQERMNQPDFPSNPNQGPGPGLGPNTRPGPNRPPVPPNSAAVLGSMKGGSPQKPHFIGKENSKKKGGHRKSDSESCSSRSSSSSGSGDSSETAPSSLYSRHSRGHGHAHDKKRAKPIGRSNPHLSPRVPFPRHPHRPPYPDSRGLSVDSEIGRAREMGYQEGRLAEKADARIAEEIAHDQVRRRPSPRIFHDGPPPARIRVIRTVNREDDDLSPRLSRLSVFDDDDVSHRRESIHRRREHEYAHGSIMSEDPFERDASSSSSYFSHDDHGHRHVRRFERRYRPPYVVEFQEARRTRGSPHRHGEYYSSR